MHIAPHARCEARADSPERYSWRKNEIRTDGSQRPAAVLVQGGDSHGNIFQSSSAENSKTTTTGGGTQTDVVTSMEVSIGTFWPVIAHQQEAQEDRESVITFGPIAEHGWKKDTGVQELVQRSYIGFRLAFSPDLYADIIGGQTEGRTGIRGEIRGQYSLTNFFVGRLMIGGAINYDFDKVEKNTDSMRLYLIYHASFNDVFDK